MSATFAIVVTLAPAVAGLHMSTVLVLYFQSEPSSACPGEPSWSKHPLDGAPKNVFLIVDLLPGEEDLHLLEKENHLLAKRDIHWQKSSSHLRRSKSFVLEGEALHSH